MIYKAAKWWTDQTYKFEDEHHGEKHEIKVKAREEYERQQAEKLKEQDALQRNIVFKLFNLQNCMILFNVFV